MYILVWFLFGLQILLPTTALANFGNGKGLRTTALRTFSGASRCRIRVVPIGYVGASEFLNRPNLVYKNGLLHPLVIMCRLSFLHLKV